MHPVQPSRVMAVARFAFLLAVAGALAACSTARPPQITLHEARLGETSDEAARIEFVMELSNPNAGPISLRQMEYRFDIAGQTVYTGRRATQTTLPALGSTSVVVPAVIRMDDPTTAMSLRDHGGEYEMSGRLEYITPGRIAEALLDIGVRRPRESFIFAGELDAIVEVKANQVLSDG